MEIRVLARDPPLLSCSLGTLALSSLLLTAMASFFSLLWCWEGMQGLMHALVTEPHPSLKS
jgi:hypothetical protein